MQHVEKEIITPVLLSQPDGTLNPEAIGYAKRPIIQSNLTKNFMRKKKWNHWTVFGEEILLSVTISHLDYIAVCLVYLLNYETGRSSEKIVTIPFGRQVKMPEQVLDSISFSHAYIKTRIEYAENETKLFVHVPDFEGDELEVELDIFHPIEEDSLNVVIPRSRNIYQFTSKHYTLPTSGLIRLGDQLHHLKSDYSFAVYDFGRGIWERKVDWNWATASQRIGNRRIGLNFGGTWTDGTGMTENAIFIDGKMFKIHEDMIFSAPKKIHYEPWFIQTKFSNHVKISFTPFFHRNTASDLKFIHTEVTQLVGYFNGTIHLPDQKPIYIRRMLGSVSDYKTKW